MANYVRIIAGYWRGKHIAVPQNALVRPTGDGIRETLFSWLERALYQARCLDLFTGSGILGLEALSRGATEVTFVDKDPNIIKALKKQLADLSLDKNKITVSLLNQDALVPIHPKPHPYDIIFLDPPFQSDLLEACIPLLKKHGYEKEGTLVYIEMAATHTLTLPSHWHCLKQAKRGQVVYQLIEVRV